MANIAISEIQTEVTELNNDDLLLVSKKNGDTFTSAKMKAGVVTNSFSSDCQNVMSAITSIAATITSLTSKIDSIQTTQNTHTDSLKDIKDLCGRIGDKVYDGTYGDNKTLTLTTSVPAGCTLTSQPTGGGTYAKGKHATITAYNPTDSFSYGFVGWYNGSAPAISSGYEQQTLSYEVTATETLTAKYGTPNRTITPLITITNNSKYKFRHYLSNYSIPYPANETSSNYLSTVTWNKSSGWSGVVIVSAAQEDYYPILDLKNLITISNCNNCTVSFNTTFTNEMLITLQGTPTSSYYNCSFTITNK